MTGSVPQRLPVHLIGYLAAMVASLVGLLIATGLFLAAYFLHRSDLGRFAVAALAVSTFASAGSETYRASRFARADPWRSYRGQLVLRTERPGLHRFWLATRVVSVMVVLAGAVFLMDVAVEGI